MNHRCLTFDRPKAVVQFHRAVVDLSKREWRQGDRVRALAWPDGILSNSGFVRNGAMVVNESILDSRHDFAKCDVLLVMDDRSGMIPPPETSAHDPTVRSVTSGNDWRLKTRLQFGLLGLYHRAHGAHYTTIRFDGGSSSFEIFKICSSGEDLAVRLDYHGHSREIGTPARPNMVIAILRAGQPVRVTLNGKVYPSLSGDEPQVYRTRDYVFEYLGDFSRFEIWPWNELVREKRVPIGAARWLNLEKRLY